MIAGILHDKALVRRKRWTNAVLIGIPVAGSAIAVWEFANRPPSSFALVHFLFWYAVTAFGVGLGFHRHFTHRSFSASPLVRLALGVAGSFAWQGNVTRWVADHRRHHAYADTPFDTHSPARLGRKGRGAGIAAFLHGHIGWMFDPTVTDPEVFAKHLRGDRVAAFLTKGYPVLALGSLAAPAAIGWLVGGSVEAWHGLLLAGCVRIALFHQVTWAVNSIGHSWGTRESGGADRSRNNLFLACLTFGEGWHNNHHAAPGAANNDRAGRFGDPIAAFLRACERLGIVREVRWYREELGEGNTPSTNLAENCNKPRRNR
jgi:stearoyl-CoA desaturase (delta-9 desaturase)